MQVIIQDAKHEELNFKTSERCNLFLFFFFGVIVVCNCVYLI